MIHQTRPSAATCMQRYTVPPCGPASAAGVGADRTPAPASCCPGGRAPRCQGHRPLFRDLTCRGHAHPRPTVDELPVDHVLTGGVVDDRERSRMLPTPPLWHPGGEVATAGFNDELLAHEPGASGGQFDRAIAHRPPARGTVKGEELRPLASRSAHNQRRHRCTAPPNHVRCGLFTRYYRSQMLTPTCCQRWYSYSSKATRRWAASCTMKGGEGEVRHGRTQPCPARGHRQHQ
jgi:hypothetical protein